MMGAFKVQLFIPESEIRNRKRLDSHSHLEGHADCNLRTFYKTLLLQKYHHLHEYYISEEKAFNLTWTFVGIH